MSNIADDRMVSHDKDIQPVGGKRCPLTVAFQVAKAVIVPKPDDVTRLPRTRPVVTRTPAIAALSFYSILQ